jgi:succinate dehydrogenase/fumarate reductase flavoprotein subunit
VPSSFFKDTGIMYYDTVVVGSGAAALNTIDWLYDLGRRDICLITEGMKMGTSRNTGSDKQTYYKLSIGSGEADSVAELAQSLFEGGGVQGPVALAEAANSVRCFMKLVNLGVDFPTDAYGQYVGYRTDHDLHQRATSAGPLTSRYMTEALEHAVKTKDIVIIDNFLAYRIIVENGCCKGIVCLDKQAAYRGHIRVVVVVCNHVVWCTGGPADCYKNVVYPASQTGMTGALLEAGVTGSNLQEWQYGLASTKFRWNVSGTYQQVLPRYISVGEDGIEREFLCDYNMSVSEALNYAFLKGYQWPFDVRKSDGSSRIDLAVYEEVAVKGHHVYLDFCNNPKGLENGFEVLSNEARNYLLNSNALFGKPIDRLRKMNPLAIELYLRHGIDLAHEKLEVSVCAQHHNGGARVNANWETNISELYVVGEAAGTFGTYRPGGSALNSTQVGSMRAAQHIAWTTKEEKPSDYDWNTSANDVAIQEITWLFNHVQGKNTVSLLRDELQSNMSKIAAQVRDVNGMGELRSRIVKMLRDFDQWASVSAIGQLPALLKLQDMMYTQSSVLDAMLISAKVFGSRGGALILDESGKKITNQILKANLQTVTAFDKTNGPSSFTDPVKPIPVTQSWFENVWNEHRHLRHLK